jgi:dipeptidyl aminopeptidase/acylaminoacyl peptidase
MGRPLATLTALVGVVALAACTGTTDDGTAPAPASSSPTGSPTGSPTASETPSPTETPTEAPTRSAAERWGPVSLPALAEKRVRGDDLRFTGDRERTASYRSREVTSRVRAGDRTLRVSGVLNVPTGQPPRGGFPAVVLAHGYIDPAFYVTGQGMTRERGFLAERGYVALHVDYRNHAASDDDPANDRNTRLGYVEDVVAAAEVVRSLREVDDDRVFLMGRSMGGGVALRTLTTFPGVYDGAVAWASVSSREPENVRQFIGDDPEDAPVLDELERRHGLPGQPGSQRFWRGVSARTFFDRVEDPVLLVHGGSDDTCPPRWARESYRALRDAGAPARLAWYPTEEHAFGPRFEDAMRRSIGFFEAGGGR